MVAIREKELLINRQIAIKNCPDYEKALYILAEYEAEGGGSLLCTQFQLCCSIL